MKKFEFSALILILFAVLRAGTTFEGSTQGVTIKNNEIPFNVTDIKERDNQTYQSVSISGASYPGAGMPSVPIFGNWVIIPNGADLSVSADPGKCLIYQNINLLPTQQMSADLIGEKTPPFVKNKDIYERNEDFPGEFYKAETPKYKRGQKSAIVWINPYQYNPVTKELKYYPDLTVNIEFNGAAEKLPANLIYPGMEKEYRKFGKYAEDIFQEEKPEITPGNKRETGCNYLIITHEDFLNAVDTLAAWKRQKGYKTEITTVNEIGTTAEEIEIYMRNAFNDWDTFPQFLLIVGDADFVPTNYKTEHPSDYNQGYTASDLYYADVNYPHDLVADLKFGRIPVETLEQAEMIINRILEYEKNPIADPNFYESISLAGAFQDGSEDYAPDQYADRRFCKTSEDLRNYFQENGKNAQRIYMTLNQYGNATVYPKYWSNAGWAVFENDAPGAEIPVELQRPNFAWDATPGILSSAVNQGTSFLIHRDHGSRVSWGEPNYNINHIDNLSNGNKFPIVFTVNCQTGWFDNETDDDDCNTGMNEESFTEHWLLSENGGSIGLFASTRVSYSGHNDRLVWGWFDAMNHDFIESNNGSYGSEDEFFKGGAILNYGKEYYMTKYTDNDEVRITALEEFHYFGDPDMDIRTEVPLQLAVNHPSNTIIGNYSLSVNCNDDNALISLLQGNEVIASGYPTNSSLILEFEPLSSMENIKLTATAPNRIYYQNEIEISSPDAPWVICTDFTINDAEGNGNNEAENNETVSLDLNFRNLGMSNASNLTACLSSDSEFINITENQISLSDINAEENIIVTNQFEFQLLNGVEDQAVLPLKIEVTDGNSTWESWLSLPVNAPLLTFDGVSVENIDGGFQIEPGESGIFKISLTNIGHNVLENALYELSSPDQTVDFAEVPAFEDINPEETQNLEFEFSVSEEEEDASIIELTFTVQTESSSWSVTESFITSSVSEDFETGNFSAMNWVSENNQWVIDNDGYSGNFSARSAPIGNNDYSSLSIELNVLHDSQISFYYKVSSESGYDFLIFKIDGAVKDSRSGITDWQEAVFETEEGIHTFEWIYQKDEGVAEGEDCAKIDFIIFPAINLSCVMPPNFEASLTDNIVTLTWDTPVYEREKANSRNSRDTQLSGFRIFKDEELLAEINDPDATEFTDTLDVFDAYRYKMRGVYGSSQSVFTPVRTILYWDPIAPHNVNAVWSSNDHSSVAVIWSLETMEDEAFPATESFQVYHNGNYAGSVAGDEPKLFLHGDFINGENRYNVLAVYEDGSVSEMSETAIFLATDNDNIDFAPQFTCLKQNTPNPFNPKTTVSFDIAEPEADVEIEIYNSKGQLVKTLIDKKMKQGSYQEEWQGKDNKNKSAASGVYFIRMNTNNYIGTKKILLLK